MPEKPTKVDDVTTSHALGRLIDDTMRTNGWTLDELSTRAGHQGHQLSPQNISRIRRQPVLTVVGKQIRALVAALGLPASVVLAAAVESMGFSTAGPQLVSPEDALVYDDRLSERDRRVALAVLTELRREDVTGHAQHPAPIAAAPGGRVRDPGKIPDTPPPSTNPPPPLEPPPANPPG